MPLCAECKKRPAVVFITDSSHPDRNIGYCFTCARKLGVPNIENMIKQFGISPEMIENMENQMADAAQNGDFPFANMLEGFNIDDLSSGYFDEDYDDEDDDDDEALDEASPEVLTDGSDKSSDESNEIKAELVESPDENDNSKSKEPPRMNPFARMFGGSFEMGGAQYADDAP